MQNHGEILFIDSVYNGEYKISGVTSETFNISPKVPEFLRYSQSDCDKLEYSTKSKNVIGTIKEFSEYYHQDIITKITIIQHNFKHKRNRCEYKNYIR